MFETVVALSCAHVLADFVFQTRWMIDHKRRFAVLALHGLIVLVSSGLCLGVISIAGPGLYAAVIVAGLHLLIDAIKVQLQARWPRCQSPLGQLWLFVIDQAAHVAVIAFVAAGFASSFSTGFWPMAISATAVSLVLAIYIGLAGLVVATRVGDLLMTLCMAMITVVPANAHAPPEDEEGLAHAGALIGVLERTLVFVFVLLGQFNAIGFVIAAKSILRFQYASQPRKSELVIIGTLASFAYAIGVAEVTRSALDHLGFVIGSHA